MKYKIRVTSDERRATKKGLTLTEMTVVVAVAAMLTTLSMPAIRAYFNSLATSASGTKAMISAALSSARAISAKEQRYAGIRFQKRYDENGPLEAAQYMIFIVHDYGQTGLANGFRAVEGLKPIKLPDTVGVMDFGLIGADADIDNEWELTDATAFSIVFSPSGKLVIHDVRVINKDGAPKWPDSLDNSNDDIFNTVSKVTDPVNSVGMFIQDDYADLGLGKESSRNSFVIYDRKKFQQAFESLTAYSGYLYKLEPIYINPYTGRIISVD